ncbi:MAG: histidine phosphatase family protein [Clostridiales bacterium]|nr:histidine phosphatase family protein [Clostridiales bacterium]
MEILLLRHGMTQGNLERRYVGRTDEPLLPSAAEELEHSEYRCFCPELVYVSPLLRCRQTAEILFPELMCGESELNRLIICEGLKEMDFGIFEYKTYEELKGQSAYRDWIDSNGTAAVPGGESGTGFRERCREAFLICLRDAEHRGAEKIAVVTHGGVIMSIMEAFARPRADYYHWQLQNGRGYQVHTDEKRRLPYLYL